MATLGKIAQFVNYLLEQYPDLSDSEIAADHEKIYLPYPDSDEIKNQLIEKGKEFDLFVSEEYDSLVVFV